jgi:hypothetical protein
MQEDIIKLKALITLNSNLQSKVGVKDGVIALHDDSLTLPSDSDINDKIAELNVSEPLAELRAERNVKLAETDWVVTMHKELGTNIPAAMKTYRQALRDITDTYTSLDDVVWPEKP